MRALILLLFAVLVAMPVQARSISFTLSPAIESGALRALNVEIVLPGDADGETELELPDDWGGKRDLWRGINGFRVTGQGMSVVAGGNQALKIIRHAPGARLTVRYQVRQFWPGEPAAGNSNEYRPVIQPGYFHVIGWTLFARPKASLAMPASVSFKDFPKNWSFASDLEHKARTLADVLQSVTVGGDFRVVKAGALRVAIRGRWPFADDGFIKRLEPIVASHHRFWGDPPDAFLVTVLPLSSPRGHMSIGGTGLSDAFAFFATNNATDGQLTRILAHEHLHSWIPQRLGTMPPENDTIDYWFSEGFADFYTYRLLMRDGLWSVEEVVQALNGVMWAYAFSPVRTAPNAKLAATFWTNAAMNELPYQRGLLFAASADARLRRASDGARDLDDVMLAMKAAAGAVGEGALAPPIRQLFVASMASAGVDVGGDIARFIEKGEAILLPADVWAPCGLVETSEVAEFDRGFDGEATITNDILATDVDPNGPAYAAGLREGMQILKLDLNEGGDSRVPLTLPVHVNGETREITYLPAGKRKVTVQALKLKALDEAGRKACAARLGGTG